jgi:hypothetical protein
LSYSILLTFLFPICQRTLSIWKFENLSIWKWIFIFKSSN